MKIGKVKINTLLYTWFAILAVWVLAFLPACENAEKVSLKEKIKTLRQEKKQLTYQIEQSKSENEQLQNQVQVLSGLKPEVKVEKLYQLENVKIGRYTNLYDKDKDGKKEKLIVYLQPIDRNGDIIKAAGIVDVQFWDLNRKNGEALLGQWHVEPGPLKKLWFATIGSSNYRLTFDVADKIEGSEGPLTVKVTFVDYLTGKVFKEQKVTKL